MNEIELLAERDLEATRQREPPFRPGLILRDIYGVQIRRGNVRGGTRQSILMPGGVLEDPYCLVSEIIGNAEARFQVGHETGHLALGHINLQGLFQPPVGFRGHTLPKNKEREAEQYGIAVTMPQWILKEDLADGPVALRSLIARFDIPERELRRRLQQIDLWRLVYDDRSRVAYRNSGWWRLTRQPRYLADLAERQGHPRAQCEQPRCVRQAGKVHHHHYETLGHEDDEDLEALCNPHHYDLHVSGERVAFWKEGGI